MLRVHLVPRQLLIKGNEFCRSIKDVMMLHPPDEKYWRGAHGVFIGKQLLFFVIC